MRLLLAFVTCGVMATCSYSKHADGTTSYTGGLQQDFELPTKGYAK